MNFEQKITKETKAARTPLCLLRCLLFKTAFFLCIFQSAFASSAQPPPQTENRFLFIINTSSAMRGLTNGIQEAVAGLLNSQMQGQMREGDTFGVWTYDDQLHTGFPMQVWSKQKQNALVETLAAALAAQPYKNKPHLDKVLPAARQIIAQSRVVTLIFIYDGSETMQGAGFDKDINDLQGRFRRQARADNVPFVTVLSARDGKVFDYRVRTPSSISLPLTADFFKPAETNAVPVVVATNPPPAVAVSKPPEPRHLEVILKPTPVPKTNPPPVAASVPAEPVAPEKPEPAVPPAPTPIQTPNPNPISPETAVASVPPINPVAGGAGSPLPAAPIEPAPQPVKTVAQTPVVPPPNPQLAAPIPNRGSDNGSEIRNPQSAIRNPQFPPAAPNPELAAPIPTRESDGGSPIRNPKSEIRNPNPSSPPPLSTAAAIPPPGDHLALLIVALSLVTVAVALILFLLRRSRAAPSLISQSLDRSH